MRVNVLHTVLKYSLSCMYILMYLLLKTITCLCSHRTAVPSSLLPFLFPNNISLYSSLFVTLPDAIGSAE